MRSGRFNEEMVDGNHGCLFVFRGEYSPGSFPGEWEESPSRRRFSVFRLGILGINPDPIHPVALSDQQEKQIPLVDKPFTDYYHNMYDEGGKKSPIQNK
jgi:hypothetical protein